MLGTLLGAAQEIGVKVDSAEVLAGCRVRLDRRITAYRATDFRLDIYIQGGSVSEEQRERLEEMARQRCGARATLLNPPAIVERVHLGPAPAPLTTAAMTRKRS